MLTVKAFELEDRSAIPMLKLAWSRDCGHGLYDQVLFYLQDDKNVKPNMAAVNYR